MSDLRIRPFQAGDEDAFRRLNEEWIERYFRLEEKDRKMLGDPRGQILDPGGAILIAEVEGAAVGCCALIASGPDTFELAKMAVTDAYRGRGLGRSLLASAIDTARSMGAVRLFLETNSKMTPAVRLYESMGFMHAQRVQESDYARSDVYMELPL
jgi:GNAT superfamily N-acetyltransferase